MKLVYLPSTALRHLADYSRSHYFVHAPYGVTMDDIMRPAFWAHHVSRLRPLDIVEVVAEDGSFDCELRVIEAITGYVRMRLLRAWGDQQLAKLTAEKVAAQEEEEKKAIKDKFPCVRFTRIQRWHVIGHDGNVVKDGFYTRVDAQEFLREYMTRSAPAVEEHAA